ncbi:MAG: right-handed parallel beta-helix repeat-containing protein [Candidatus Thermoplasmatota archaeon]|nr:right-handed parallel beta-helix repeat-containing protein [Candidatus Thermoplasmatota archaeon]
MDKKVFIIVMASAMVISSIAVTFAYSGSGIVTVQKYQTPEVSSGGAFQGNVTIFANGSVSSSTEIAKNGNLFTLNNNLNGTLIDLRNGSILSGNGFTVNGLRKTGIEVLNASSVTIEDAAVLNSSTALYVSGSSYVLIKTSNLSSFCFSSYVSESNYVSFVMDKFYTPDDYGIYAYNTPEVFVNSSSFDTSYGFITYSSTSELVFTEDSIVSYYGIEILGYTNNNVLIAKNTFIAIKGGGYSGVCISNDNSNSVNISNNKFYNFSHYALYEYTGTGKKYVISHNMIVNSSTGIRIEDLYGASISFNEFNNISSTGIEGCYMFNSTVNGNIITNSSLAYGVYFEYSDMLNFNNNQIRNTSYAVYIEYSNILSVVHNSLLFSKEGAYIYSYSANNVNVSDNVVRNMTQNGIEVFTEIGANYSVNDNYISNSNDPICVEYDIQNLKIDGNKIYNTTGTAICTDYVSSLTVSGNFVSGFIKSSTLSNGIEVDHATNAVISNNTVLGNATIKLCVGICTCAISQGSVYSNYVSNSTYGYDVCGSGNITVFDNVGTNNSYGIYSEDNSQFTYYGNSITDSKYSFNSCYDSIGAVFDNTFSNASTYMVYIYGSYHIEFYHNNFLNGTSMKNFIIDASNLSWNLSLPVGGNYWSSYNGTGPDGIGSTPYAVNGSNMDFLPLTSKWSSYTITYVESGLPSGTAWSVILDASSLMSTTQTIVFSPTAAQHIKVTYSVATVPGYSASVKTGSVNLNGTSMVIMVTFSPVKYNVTFTETGLTAGTTWSVTIGGLVINSVDSSLTVELTNGTYNYSIGSVAGFHSTISSGVVIVNGSGPVISVTFIKNSYVLTVTETGLPAGSSWSVSVNGESQTSKNVSIQFILVSGNYSVKVSGPSGYTVSLSSSTAYLNDTNATVTAVFKTPPSTSIYDGLGAGVVVGAIVGVLATMAYTGTGTLTE